MNYAYLLKTAPLIDDSSKRLKIFSSLKSVLLRTLIKVKSDENKHLNNFRIEWIATFAVSALASNFERMGKPFNPLLGETYELERSDFRILCEQVRYTTKM